VTPDRISPSSIPVSSATCPGHLHVGAGHPDKKVGVHDNIHDTRYISATGHLDTQIWGMGVPNKKNNPSYVDIDNRSENIYDFFDNTSFFKKGV
jgi:hypothetical protein